MTRSSQKLLGTTKQFLTVKSMSKIVRIGVTFPPDLLEDFDEIIKQNGVRKPQQSHPRRRPPLRIRTQMGQRRRHPPNRRHPNGLRPRHTRIRKRPNRKPTSTHRPHLVNHAYPPRRTRLP